MYVYQIQGKMLIYNADIAKDSLIMCLKYISLIIMMVHYIITLLINY